MIDRSNKRWIILGLAAALAAMLGWSLWGTVVERRLRTGLAEAASDMEAGNFDRSSERLRRLADRYRGQGEVLFRLGESELACGRVDRAAIAWSQVPKGSPFAAAAALKQAQLELPAGQFTAAETILRGALEEPGPEAGEVRHLLLSILGLEGRLDEARDLIEQHWHKTRRAARDERLALLREHLALDLETFPLEGNLAFLQNGGPPGTGDARLWLARGNLATRSGKLDEAARWLDAALLRQPDDPVLWQARLDWAMAAGRPDRVKEALAHRKLSDLGPVMLARLAAWLAARQGDVQSERTALETLVELEPGEESALDRLAELAFQAGRTDDGRRLRVRKSELDRDKDRYLRLFKKGQLRDDAVEMAGTALALGRSFEALAFLTLVEPGNTGTNAAAPAGPARAGPADPRTSQGDNDSLASSVAGLLRDQAGGGRAGPFPGRRVRVCERHGRSGARRLCSEQRRVGEPSASGDVLRRSRSS